MFRRLLRKLIPSYAIFPLAMTGIMNLIAYQVPKLLQLFTGTARTIDMTTAFDRATPFLPIWVLMYIATFLFWIYQNTTVAKDSPEMAYRLVAADFVAKLMCLVCFVVIPTTNVRPTVEGSGFHIWLMKFIYWIDTPTNLFPSIHCFVAWLGTRMMFDCKHLSHKTVTSILCVIGSLMVFLSTLFTKQHVIYDVISGVLVAELGYLVAKYTALPRLFERINTRFLKTKLSQIL